MKKLIIITTLFLALSLVYAEEPQSMRNIASDGIFEGSWEDVFDPIDLGEINNYFIFTNFTDFSIEYDDMYGDLENNSETKFFEEFPIGVAFTNPFVKNLKHSLYIKLRSNLVPSYIADYEEYVTTYEDITGDDIYDVKTIEHLHAKDNSENNLLFNFIWNNNYQLNDFNIGLKLSSFTIKEEIDDLQTILGVSDFGNYGLINGFWYGDHQTDFYKEFYEIEEENYFFKYSEKGDFSTKIKDNQTKFQLSLEKDNTLLLNESTLRFDLGLDMHQNLSRNTEDEYIGSYEEIVLADTLVNSGNISDSYNRQIERNEKDIYISTILKKELDSSFEGELGFWETGIDVGYILGDKKDLLNRYISSEEKIDSLNSVEYTIIETRDDIFEREEKGDISGIHFGTHLLMNLPLNDYSIFGFGGFYSFSNVVGNYDYVMEELNVDTYQVGSMIDTETEYVRNETEFISADKQSIIHSSNFRFPVALEFKIPENHTSQNDGFGLRNFVFRLGSTFFLNCTKTENTYDIIEKNPNLIITEYGDGTVTESHDASNEFNSNKEIVKTIESTKRFSGGIGYKHSDNLSIDLGGFYNYDTDIYYVGLSFTINR